MIYYIHGFNSGPGTASGRKLRECFPNMPVEILAYDSAWDCQKIQENLEKGVKKKSAATLIVGSSLGGYHAAKLASALNVPSVLVNPCNNPRKSLEQFLGENVSFEDGHHWIFTRQTLESYTPLDIGSMGRLPDLVLIGRNDELLDPAENASFWEGHTRIIFTKDAHSIESFMPAREAMLKMLCK